MSAAHKISEMLKSDKFKRLKPNQKTWLLGYMEGLLTFADSCEKKPIKKDGDE